MYGIIPLAGPDFYQHQTQVTKPLMPIDGEPLIKKVLTSRSWITSGELPPEKLIFILRDTEHTAAFCRYLASEYPTSPSVKVSSLTNGALLSAVAGCSLIKDFSEPLVVDLVDILYQFDLPISPSKLFNDHPQLGGLLPVFNSDHPQYSYARLDADDPQQTLVTETVEKQVISRLASAGTYFFRDVTVFLAAVAHNLASSEKFAYQHNLFLCPAYNSVIANGWDVRTIPSRLELSVSLMDKPSS